VVYESIIFDVDGTLWDSRALLADAYNAQLAQEGLTHIHVTAEKLRPLFGKTMTAIADGLFDTVSAPERYHLMDRCILRMDEYLEKYADTRIAYPDIRKTMETLAKKHRLFIVSNGQKGYPQLAAKKLEIADLISGYLSFGDTGADKGQTILQLMQQENISSAAYVGDTQGDLEACQKAGIPFVWAAFGFGKPETWDEKIERFSDLNAL
jgi:phosphoglycolate phosphatase